MKLWKVLDYLANYGKARVTNSRQRGGAPHASVRDVLDLHMTDDEWEMLNLGAGKNGRKNPYRRKHSRDSKDGRQTTDNTNWNRDHRPALELRKVDDIEHKVEMQQNAAMKKEIEVIQTGSFHSISSDLHLFRTNYEIYENGTFKKDSTFTKPWGEDGK